MIIKWFDTHKSEWKIYIDYKGGITREQLADKPEVVFQTVSQWELERSIQISLLPKLVDALHVISPTMLGITEAHEKDINIVVEAMWALSSAQMKTNAIISCLREIHHSCLKSAAFWQTRYALP